MRKEGFFAMKIPKEWGGKGFSTAAVSAVLCKVTNTIPGRRPLELLFR